MSEQTTSNAESVTYRDPQRGLKTLPLVDKSGGIRVFADSREQQLTWAVVVYDREYEKTRCLVFNALDEFRIFEPVNWSIDE